MSTFTVENLEAIAKQKRKLKSPIILPLGGNHYQYFPTDKFKIRYLCDLNIVTKRKINQTSFGKNHLTNMSRGAPSLGPGKE